MKICWWNIDVSQSRVGAMSLKTSSMGDVKWMRESVYASLMAYRRGHLNDHHLAYILSTHMTTGGGMPKCLGLSPVSFAHMMNIHFPGAMRTFNLLSYGEELDSSRADERKELVDLMWSHCTRKNESVQGMAQIVAVGCMGSNHLWQDLGLWSRDDLSILMAHNFPKLATKNNRDMKWKKFLYKQLCIQEGIYSCRAPSCEVCKDYDACFSVEE
jgi:nitrogen fixation protein NifQ